MVNQVKGLACIIIDENDRIHTSKNIHYHDYKKQQKSILILFYYLHEWFNHRILYTCKGIPEEQTERFRNVTFKSQGGKDRVEFSIVSRRCFGSQWWQNRRRMRL
jgi:hypothetical protein